MTVAQQSTLLKGAEFSRYSLAGYVLIPLRDTDRKPYRGWRQVAFDPCYLPRCANAGIALQDDDLVLDVDPRRYNGADELVSLKIKFPELVNCGFEVNTKSGGFHLYFKKPPTAKLKALVPGCPAIECKRAGQYVVAAGSPDYSIRYGSPALVTQASTEFIAYLTEDQSILTEGLETDDTATIEQYTEFLLTCDSAVEGDLGDLRTFKTAATGKDLGLSQDRVLDLMLAHYNDRCQPPWTETRLREKVAHAFAYTKNEPGCHNALVDFADLEVPDEPTKPAGISFHHTKQGELKSNLHNVVSFLKLPAFAGKLRFNDFSGKVEVAQALPWRLDMGAWSDFDTIELKCYLSGKGLDVQTGLCLEGAKKVSRDNRYHPVRDYLNGLEWDGVSRINDLFSTYARTSTNAKLAHEFARVLMLGAVARVMLPGCQYDYMIVLEGEQGIGKTRFAQTLGGLWYVDLHHLDPDNKDLICDMAGKWVAEISEMKFTTLNDIVKIKSFITRKSDTTRLPYDQCSSDHPRQTILIGTINPDATGEYLRDKTGNRRFLPVECCGRIDIERLAQDRDQLFAEAVHRFNLGESWELDRQMEQEINMLQNTRVARDTWDEVIADWLHEHANPVSVSTDVLCVNALGVTTAKFTRSDNVRLAEVMKQSGYVHKQVWNAQAKRNSWLWTKLMLDSLEGCV